MIPKDYITAWRAEAPWLLDAQVEQDLVISRAIVNLFAVPELANSLAFRGGTALYKIYLTPPARYSEDIDLVQVRAESIGGTLDRAAGDGLLGTTGNAYCGSPHSPLTGWVAGTGRQTGELHAIYAMSSVIAAGTVLMIK